MKKTVFKAVLAVAACSFWSVDFAPEAPYKPVLAAKAQAVVGRPATPVSVAGVARRSTRRAVYATNASQQQAQKGQQAQQAQPAQQTENVLPKGTVVSALPSGCTSVKVDGVDLFNCSGQMYQPKFQSNQLVYVVM
jgi:hypothetical protein